MNRKQIDELSRNRDKTNKIVEEGKDDQKDAVYDMKYDMEMDAGACEQETAKVLITCNFECIITA